ncbi:hypothetical protein [Sphingobacterium endophyticum]|uniref:hypothetical protein n=1 Tax=Sphingobacterium endophyticum TaxID=2546448 RepID=UPI0012E134DA|nr:hypothetical protein [Sphingobacterium endophyticum]
MSTHYIDASCTQTNEIQNRNNALKQAFINIEETLLRVQSWLKHEELRFSVKSDFLNSKQSQSLIKQITTPFAIVSLGCSPEGIFSIVYSLDHRIKDLIGDYFTNTLLRRIYEFTSGDLEGKIHIGSLNSDCFSTISQMIDLAENNSYHNVTTTDFIDGLE